MTFSVGDIVQLKSGGPPMTVARLFKSLNGREMADCTWREKQREHRAAFLVESLKNVDEART